MSNLELHHCQLNPSYLFHQCEIQSCKNHSPVLSSHCLLIERTEVASVDKGLTDHEIRFFKDYRSMRLLTRDKRLATRAVYLILILDKYIEYCTNLKPRTLQFTDEAQGLIDRLFSKYPFSLKEICVSEDHLFYLFSQKTYQRFLNSQVSCTEFELHEVLHIKPRMLRKLSRLVRQSYRKTMGEYPCKS